MNGNGMPSPEELDEIERQRAYWGSPALSSSASAGPTPEQIVSHYGPPPPPAPIAPPGLAPGDPGFAMGVLGTPAAPPIARPPAGPAPGDPGFGLAQVAGMGSPPAPPPPVAPPGMAVIGGAAAADAIRATNASIDVARRNADEVGRARANGVPSIVFNGPIPVDPGVTPTPAEDRAFEQFKRTQAASAASARPAGGGVARGGAAPNDDYWGVKKAQRDLLATYGAQAESMGRESDAETAKNETLADEHANLARLRQQHALIAQEQEQQANDRFESHLSETQRQLDDVKAKKIDPHRYMKDRNPILTVVGAVAGGMYMGLNRLDHNPFLDDLNMEIDRDIDAQKTDLANEREAVGTRLSMLGQMRSIYKDHTLAELQTRSLYYEAAKDQIAADAAHADTPIKKERANQAIIAVNREQTAIDLAKRERAKQVAEAQAAAAAHAQQAAIQQNFDNAMKVGHLGVERRKADIEEGKIGGSLAERFVATGKDEATGAPTGYLARNAESAKLREESRSGAQQLIAKIDRVREIRNSQGWAGRNVNRDWTLGVVPRDWQTQLESLEAEMTTDWAHAKNLGALSDSDRKLAKDAIGDLQSRGSQSDVRLEELKRTLEAKLKAETDAASGVRATKVIDPATGRERILVHGTQNAPNNAQTTQRFSVTDGKPILSDPRTKTNVQSALEYYGAKSAKPPERDLALSDPRAKQEVYALGRAHGFERATTGKPVEWAYEMPNDVTERTGMSGPRARVGESAGGRAAASSVERASTQRALEYYGAPLRGAKRDIEGALDETARRGTNVVRAAAGDADRGLPPPGARQATSFTRGASTVDTALTPDEERDFVAWKEHYAPHDSGGDYDLRGAYKAGVAPDPRSGHWPDTFKKPNHPTFSDESQYAKQGAPGRWDGETFIPAAPPPREDPTLAYWGTKKGAR